MADNDNPKNQLMVVPNTNNPAVQKIIADIDLEKIDEIVKDGMVKGKPTARLIKNLQTYLANFVGDIIRADPNLSGKDIETHVKIQGLLTIEIIKLIQLANIFHQGSKHDISMKEYVKYTKASHKLAESLPRQSQTYVTPFGSSKVIEDSDYDVIEQVSVDIKDEEAVGQ